jgi:hypothetical protein
MMLCPELLLAAASLVTAATANTIADWPAMRGPSSDGTTSESIGLREWPKAGPPIVWRVETRPGFSSFAVADDKAFTLIGRSIDGEAREVCAALDAASGKELWSQPLGKAKYDGGGDAGTSDNKGGDGPRSTPVVADGRVHALDAHLNLTCLDAGTGEILWQQDLLADYEGRQ